MDFKDKSKLRKKYLHSKIDSSLYNLMSFLMQIPCFTLEFLKTFQTKSAREGSLALKNNSLPSFNNKSLF